MAFLQKAKEKANEVAREAADASARAAEALSAKAQDPETQAKLQQTAVAVRAKATDPEMHAKVKSGLAAAGRKTRTVVERIDPGLLADVIIKATALQEKANARLRAKGSIYRIGELAVTASLPPGVSFSIVRVSEREEEMLGKTDLRSSAEILAEQIAVEAENGGEPSIVSLDGEEQDELAALVDEVEASPADS